MAEVVVIVPVLRRPHRVAPLLDSVAAATPDGAWRVLFVASPEDTAEQNAVRAAYGDLLVIDEPNAPGDWSRKINHGYRATVEPLLLLGGDDIDFHPGWLEAATRKMTGKVGVVGTNDLHNGRVLAADHSTHPVVARWYADEHGTVDGPGVVHEGYAHNYPDTELVETAKKRRAWAFARDSIVEHNHPLWHNGEGWDDVYALGRSRFEQDRLLYRRRRRLWK